MYLMRDIWSSIADISAHLSHDSNVLIAVQEREFFILSTRFAGVGSFVSLETRIRQDDNQSLSVFISSSDRSMLLSDHLG